MFQLKWNSCRANFQSSTVNGYTQSSGSIIDYVILRIFVLLALSICWSWSLNREECEAKRAFDSQSHQFDRGGTHNDLGESRKLLLLHHFRNIMFVGRDMGYGNDDIIDSGLSDNTDSDDIIITDDNHMGGIGWYYYYYLQDGEVENDSHDISAVFTPGALISNTPKLWMHSTSLRIGTYDAMAILSSGYLHTVTPSHIRSCHYCFVCPTLLSTRPESQYVHNCHRCHLMSNNGEWSNRVLDTGEDNDDFYDCMAGYHARPSIGAPEDGLNVKIGHLSPKRGDDMEARAMVTTTEEMLGQVAIGSNCQLLVALMEETANVSTLLDIHSFVAIEFKQRVTVILQQDRPYGETTRLILYHCHYWFFRYDKFGSRCMIVYPTAMNTLWDVDIIFWSTLAYGSLRKFATPTPAPMDAQTLFGGRDVRSISNLLHDTLCLHEWIDVTTWTQCLIAKSPISSALHTIHITNANIVNPWGAVVDVIRSPTYTKLMTTYHTSTWIGYYYSSFAVTAFGPCFSTDTLPLHMHSCRCSNHDGGDIPWTVSSVSSLLMMTKNGESSCILSHRHGDVCSASIFVIEVECLTINFFGLSRSNVKKVFINWQSHHSVHHQLCRCAVRHEREDDCGTSAFVTCCVDVEYSDDINAFCVDEIQEEKKFIVTTVKTAKSHYHVQPCCLVCLRRNKVNEESSAMDSSLAYWSQFVSHIAAFNGDTVTPWGTSNGETSYVVYFSMSRENGEPVSCSIKPEEHGVHNPCVRCVVVLRKHEESTACSIDTQHPLHRETALQTGFFMLIVRLNAIPTVNHSPLHSSLRKQTVCHGTSTNAHWSSYNSKSNRDVLQSDNIMDTYVKMVTTSCVPTWRDNSGSTVDSTAKKTKSTTFAMLCDVSGIHMKSYGYGNVGVSYDSCQLLPYRVIDDSPMSLCCRLDILMRRPGIIGPKKYLDSGANGSLRADEITVRNPGEPSRPIQLLDIAGEIVEYTAFNDPVGVDDLFEVTHILGELLINSSVFVHEQREVPINFESYRQFFLHAPREVVMHTFDATTRYYQYVPNQNRITETIRSHFPAANAPRRHEIVSGDTLFFDLEIGGGVRCCQFFIGRRSYYMSVWPMRTDGDFVNALEDEIRFRGAMEVLFTDNAQAEISNRVKDLLRNYRIRDHQSEAYYQHQNFAERYIQELKKLANRVRNKSGCPPDMIMHVLEYVVFIWNRTAHRILRWRMSDVPDLQYAKCDRLLSKTRDATETATLGMDIVICADSYELEIARGYCYEQSLSNVIDSPYKSSRDGKESSVLPSSGPYCSPSALMTKLSLSSYADTQVCVYAMHNFHLMHLVRSQDHGELIACTSKWRRKSGEPMDYIVKSRKYGERIVCTITPQHSLHHSDVAIHIIATRIEPIAETNCSSVDDNFDSYVETIGITDCVIGHFDVGIENDTTNGAGKSYANGSVDWGAVFEPITNIYGHYCAAWKAQGKPSSLMSDTSVTSYADIRTSSSPCTVTRRLPRLLLTLIQPFEMPLFESNCRSIDSEAMYTWTTSETSEDDVAVEVEEKYLTDDTNMPSCASLVHGEQLLHGMTDEVDIYSTRDNDATIDRFLFSTFRHPMQQLMKRRFGGSIYVSPQQMIDLAWYYLSHEHHIIMVVFCIILHALIAPLIVPANPYDASANTTTIELRVYAIRKDTAPLDRRNNTSSSTSMDGYDTVDIGTRSSDTVVEENPMSVEGEQPYEEITLSGLRTRYVVTDDEFTSGLSIPTVDLYLIGISAKIENSFLCLSLLSSECIPQHLNELCRNDPTSSGRTHDATIANFSSDKQPQNASHTNHFMLPYNFALENIAPGMPRFDTMVKYWAHQAMFIWLILQPVLFWKGGKLKLASATSNTTASNGQQTVGRLMGSYGLQYHIDRTNNGTNRRGVTTWNGVHVSTDSISTIDASTFREYWYSKSSQISRWCSHGF